MPGSDKNLKELTNEWAHIRWGTWGADRRGTKLAGRGHISNGRGYAWPAFWVKVQADLERGRTGRGSTQVCRQVAQHGYSNGKEFSKATGQDDFAETKLEPADEVPIKK